MSGCLPFHRQDAGCEALVETVALGTKTLCVASNGRFFAMPSCWLARVRSSQ